MIKIMMYILSFRIFRRYFPQGFSLFYGTGFAQKFCFLLRLIASDEGERYAVTHAIFSALKGGLTWTKPEDAISGFYG
ncbi:MAG: hypothetical protein HYY45_00870 [Deltaproteobacteria bacterium]|nr:hypothetical protein [Deltaproteobacteria bacterium]